MWPTFLFGCLFEALSGALVATFWLRMRKAERAIAQKLSENGELQGQLKSREALAVEQQAAINAARNEQAAISRQLGVATERCAQLEKAVQARSDHEQQQQLLVQQLKDTWSARARDLESKIAKHEHDLQQRAATIENLRSEAAESESLIQTQVERNAQLELRLQQVAERAAAAPTVSAAHDEASIARIAELESQLASLQQQLETRGATLAGSAVVAAAQEASMEALSRRCDELEAQLQRATKEEQARLQREQESQAVLAARAEQLETQLQRVVAEDTDRLYRDQELQAALRARAGELEGTLAGREEELGQRQAAIARLQGEIETREGQLSALGRRCEELQAALRSTLEQSDARLRQEQGISEALSARAGELEQDIESREQEMLERQATIERLQGELAHRQQQLDALGARCSELEQELERANVEHSELSRREQATSSALSARVVALEDQIAERVQEPLRDAALIERLQSEADAKHAQIEQLQHRLHGLEHELQAQREHALELRRIDDELQCALSARASELEAQVADSVEDLHREIASTQALEDAVDATAMQLEVARSRNVELEQQVRRRAQQQVEQEALSLARADQLEAELASRNERIRELRAECEQLASRCNAIAELVEQRVRELADRDRQLSSCNATLEALNFAVAACDEAMHADEALIDELACTRIAALFRQRKSQRSKSLPAAYLEGLAQGDLGLALQGLLGDAQLLSAPAVERLAACWQRARESWKQSLLQREVAYLWTCGVHLEAGIEREGDALLVVVAACVDGSRIVLAVEKGERDSKQAWLSILNLLAGRGMNVPRLVVGDSALGVWSAIDELGWSCARQFCWSAKTAQVLAALPRPRRAQAAHMLAAIAEAGSRTAARQLRDRFVKRCGVRLAAVAELVTADWKCLSSVHAFPKEHWSSLRTAELVEAPLLALRLRAARPKATKPAPELEAILWRLLRCAVESWPALDALELVPSLISTQRRAQAPAPAAEPQRAD